MNLIQAIAEYGNLLKTKGDREAYEWMCEEGFSLELRDHIKGCFENSDNILEDDADLRFFINGEEHVNISEIRIECNFGEDEGSMTTVISREGIITDTFRETNTESEVDTFQEKTTATRGQTFEEMFEQDFPED